MGIEWRIHRIDEQKQAILDAAFAASGEVTEEQDALIADFDAHAEELTVDLLRDILNSEHLAKVLKEKSDELKKRSDAIWGAVEKKRDWLIRRMENTSQDLIVDGQTGISAKLRENTGSVNVTDPDKLPSEFRRIIPAKWEPDKVAIGKALKSGSQVDGAELVRSRRIEIK